MFCFFFCLSKDKVKIKGKGNNTSGKKNTKAGWGVSIKTTLQLIIQCQEGKKKKKTLNTLLIGKKVVIEHLTLYSINCKTCLNHISIYKMHYSIWQKHN
jgi:hypothetical protein